MDRTHVEQAVLSVLTAILKHPFDGHTDVTRQNTASWDSLKHIEIMFALEDELDTEFSEDELVTLDSVAKIVDAVLVKHAP
ncbi:MAG: acyl carrier protein [Nitrospirota bacterium]|nr:acyl carrier protein [Nitrospirota bacterium]